MGYKLAYYVDNNIGLKVELNFSLADWEKYFSPEEDSLLAAQLANEIKMELDKRFQRGGGERPWKQKKPLTKAFEGGASRPLIYTGKLKDSFEWLYAAGEVMVFTRRPYAKVQNFGAAFTTTKRQTMWMFANLFNGKGGMPVDNFFIQIPARRFMYFTQQLTGRLRHLILTWIRKSERLGDGV